MLHCFFLAQLNNPSRNDWIETVKEDLVDLEISMDLEELKKLSHDQAKNLVREKCRSAAFKLLLSAKANHSKMSALNYSELGIQQYLVNKSFHSGDARMLFSFRTRMVKVKNNYKNSHNDLHCPLCERYLDTQEHLLGCEKIHQSPPVVSYNDIFGDDCGRMKQTFDVLKDSLHIRGELLRATEEVAGVAV